MIRAEQVRVAYGGHVALDGVDLSARSRATVGLVGPNGSGKSTLLRTLYAALSPLGGRVVVDDADIAGVARREIARRVAVVSQDPPAQMAPTVAESVLLGRLPHSTGMLRPRAADAAIVEASLAQVGAAHLARRSLHTLSGGERQRVVIARAIAQQAGHLLLDEPTNHLDVRHQHEIMRLVRSLRVTTVIVLHDLNLAARYCDALVLLSEGRVIASGAVDAVLCAPVLEPVYRMTVNVVRQAGQTQLLFDHPDEPVAAPPPNPDPH